MSEETSRPDTPSTGAPEPAPEPPDKAPSRLRRAQEMQRRMKASAIETGERFERRREGDQRVDYILSAYERDRATGGVVLSGAVAFRLFLFFVPFVVFIVLLLGVGSTTSGSNQDLARKMGIGGLIARAAGGTNHLSGWERITSLVVVAIGVFYGARALYRVLHIVFSLEWSRPISRVRSTRPALLTIGFVALSLGTDDGLSRLRASSSIGGLLGTIVVFFLLPAGFSLVALVYLPHDPECPWWAQLPGALLLAVGVEAVHLFTIYWVAREITKKSEVYGSIGGSLAILLWAYVIGRLIILASVINSVLWDRYRPTRSKPPTGAVTQTGPYRLDGESQGAHHGDLEALE